MKYVPLKKLTDDSKSLILESTRRPLSEYLCLRESGQNFLRTGPPDSGQPAMARPNPERSQFLKNFIIQPL